MIDTLVSHIIASHKENRETHYNPNLSRLVSIFCKRHEKYIYTDLIDKGRDWLITKILHHTCNTYKEIYNCTDAQLSYILYNHSIKDYPMLMTKIDIILLRNHLPYVDGEDLYKWLDAVSFSV